jgi:DNA transformation protein
MAVSNEFRDYVIERLGPIGDVRARAMFGGCGVFESGDMFALMSESELFFKVDDSNRAGYEENGSRRFGRTRYFSVPDQVIEDTTELERWALTAIAVGHAAARKKSGRKG